MSDKREITLVVVNYNSSHYVDNLLRSVKNGLDKCNHCFTIEVIIVDNASNYNDYSQLMEIVSKYSRYEDISIRVIRNKKNYGYAGGVNIGVKIASHDFVIISNPDIVFREDFFQKLRELLVHRDSGNLLTQCIIAPKILLKQNCKVNSKGLYIHAAGYGLLRGLYECEEQGYEKVDYILSPHGALFISSKKILEHLGPFDLFLYSFLEDLDLGIRAYLYGYKVMYVPYLVAYHDWGVSWGLKLSSVKYYLTERNRLIIITRELPERFIVASLPFILISELVSLIYAIKARYPHLKAMVYSDVLKNLSRILSERRRLKTGNFERLASILAKESTWRFKHIIFENRDVLLVNRLYQSLSYLTRFIWPWRD